MQKATYENKSLVSIHGVKPGSTFEVAVDAEGVPLEKRWRDRLRDAAVDGAIVRVDRKGGKK